MEFKKMVNRSVYVLFVIGLAIATLTSTILQLLSIEEGEYVKSQFISPNLATKDVDTVKISNDLDHLFVFVQVRFLKLIILSYIRIYLTCLNFKLFSHFRFRIFTLVYILIYQEKKISDHSVLKSLILSNLKLLLHLVI